MKYEVLSQGEGALMIKRRLDEALRARDPYTVGWGTIERLLFRGEAGASLVSYSYDNLSEVFSGDLSSGNSTLSINYAFKYYRYILSLMSANPPSASPLKSLRTNWMLACSSAAEIMSVPPLWENKSSSKPNMCLNKPA